ncbi:MAG TPA: hypothetical protein EYH38_07455 [Leucothrix sp.]|nr:hypothetical protein [Leucothrix sp.]
MNISKKTEKAFQILRDWDSKKYEYDQRFLFFYLNDIMEIPENFTDDEDDLLGWLTDWHDENIVIKDCDEKGHSLMTFSSKDGSYHALWAYPGLIGEPPVVFFESGYPARIVASSLEEFVCRLGKSEIVDEDDCYFALVAESYDIDDEEEATKATIADYEKFRKTVTDVIDCSLFNDRHKLMQRHSLVTSPLLSFEKVELALEGDYIASLINLPITDSRVLSVLTKVGYEIPLFAPKKGDFSTPSNKKGLTFHFGEDKKTEEQMNDGLQTLYLETIEFNYTNAALPFDIKDTDSYKVIAQKLQHFNEYYDTDDEDLKYWYSNNKEFYICICISFEDSKFGELYDLSISSYTPPSELGLVKLSHG